MSNQSSFKLKSLLQLTDYSQLVEFLKQYHNVVKEEFGQYLGVQKALVCLSKVFDKYENHHEMISDLKNMENKKELFSVRKEIVTITVVNMDGSIIESLETKVYSSSDDIDKAIKSELEDCFSQFSLDKEDLLNRFDSLFDDEEIEEFESAQDVIDAVVRSNIGYQDLINDIEALSDDKLDIRVEQNFLDLDITPSDINHSLNNM
jgi:hypothetical protein